MSKALQTAAPINTSLLEQVVIGGDLAKLSPDQRVAYYRDMCSTLGLNPLTKPFAYLTLNGKLVLYAQRDCTDQLRKINGVSVELTDTKTVSGAYTVIAKATDKTGRIDSSTGAVWIEGLKGEAMCNAMMKAETKAKRRVTLSICGLGLMDDSEVDSVPAARRMEETDIVPPPKRMKDAPKKDEDKLLRDTLAKATGAGVLYDKETGEIHENGPEHVKASDLPFGFPPSDNIGPEPELPVPPPQQTDETARAETWANRAIDVIDRLSTTQSVEDWLTKNKNPLARCQAANPEAGFAVVTAAEMRQRALGAA